MIKVLIADDEKHARDRLKELLQAYNNLSIEAEAATGDEVIQILITQDIDVAFLDIEMPGTSVFNTINSLKKVPLVIFQTAYSQYAVNAFEINALDYLLKPISEERLRQAVEKILNAETKPQAPTAVETEVVKEKVSTLSIKVGEEIKLIDIDDIYKITFEEGFCFLYTAERRYLSDKYLNYYDELLSDNGFFRCSRNDIVNLKYIKSIHTMFKGSFLIELKNEVMIKVSRRRAKELKDIINV